MSDPFVVLGLQLSSGRLSYFWHNPNHSAATIVAFISLLWAVQKNAGSLYLGNVSKGVVYGGELAATVMLVLTGSRGGFIGYLAAAATFALISRRSIVESGASGARGVWGVRLAVLPLAMLVSPLPERMGAIAAGDGSTAARLTLWHGGLVLLDAKPSGWGLGKSGYTYLNLVQEASDSRSYTTMVNSYVEIAVALGISALFLYTFVLCSCWFILATQTPGNRLWAFAGDWAACSLAGVICASIFTTMLTVWSVGLIGLVCCCVAAKIFVVSTKNKVRWTLVVGAASAGILCSICLALGSYFNSRRPWQLRYHDGLVVYAKKPTSSADKWVSFVVDRGALGTIPGKEIRTALLETPGDIALYSISESLPVGTPSYQVLFGAAANLVRHVRADTKHTLIVAPTCAPPEQAGELKHCILVLSDVDEAGFQSQWRAWASRNNVTILRGKLVGRDVSVVFGAIWREWITSVASEHET